MKQSNVCGAKGPFCLYLLHNQEGKDEMTKASVNLQDLSRRIYVKAKAEKSWQGLRLEAVEYAMAVRISAAVQRPQGSVAYAESRPSTIGPIT